MARQTKLGILVAGLLFTTGAGYRSPPGLSAQRMVAAGTTIVYPAGFVVVYPYYNSNCQEGLAFQFSDVIAHTDYYRLVSGSVTRCQIQ